MSEFDFFKAPILNSPYEYPSAHWELVNGLPTNRVQPNRRRAELLSPIPKAKKQKTKAKQAAIDFDDKTGLEVDRQKYDLAIINELRGRVDAWRELKNPNDWGVTPDTARLLQHWRHHPFNGVRPFFCQIEAVETAIWLTEVAPHDRNGKRFLEHLDAANDEANSGLSRLALKLATGAGKTTVMAMLIAWQTVRRARKRRLIRNDSSVCRVIVEKQVIPIKYANRTDPPAGRLLVRPYKKRAWPLQVGRA